MSGSPRGIALLNMGSPESADDTRAFLFRLFTDPDIFRFPGGALLRPLFAGLISTLRAPRVRRRYAAIGGISPLLEITRRQASALEAALEARGDPMPVEVCMRYSPPYARQAVARLVERGAREVVGFPLYPQYSTTTTGSSLRALREAAEAVAPEVPVLDVRHWFEDDAYQAVMAARTHACLDPLRGEDRIGVFFLAHSIPERFVREGDPYIQQVRETVAGIGLKLRKRLGCETIPQHLAYQGQVGPVRWVGPSVEEELGRMFREGIRSVVAVPVSFVSDHLETLYEIDIEVRERAAGLGIKTFQRIPSLNAEDDFIRVLAGVVLQRVGR